MIQNQHSSTFRHIDPSRPLVVVVDTSVFLHKLDQQITLDHLDEGFVPTLRANFVYLVSGAWLPKALRAIHTVTLFACDTKTVRRTYWRHDWLADPAHYLQVPRKNKKAETLRCAALDGQDVDHSELAILYKSGRKLPTYRFKRIKQLIQGKDGWIEKLGYKKLHKSGYEADDMAAMVVKINRDQPETDKVNLLLLTVDTDWLGMVDPHVTWCCMTGYSPRVRDTIDIVSQWSESRLGEPIDTWRDIWDIKSYQGDKSDNLPPSQGYLLPVIDLMNPPPEYSDHLKPSPKNSKLFWEDGSRRASIESLPRALDYLRLTGQTPVINAFREIKDVQMA